MNNLYPLKFRPVFKEKIWGGNKISTKLGMNYAPLPNCGEAWTLSGVSGFQTLVANGYLEDNELNELVEVYMGDLTGDEVFERYGDEFPILVKFIDTTSYLSVQVHPDDRLAGKRHNTNGKTELWYILDADPGAELISGFDKKIRKEEFVSLLNAKKIKEVLHTETVNSGDVFYTPAGRVHAIGPGILLAEIQQTSDITYRVYDWDRLDEKGRSRELHVEQALEAIDFTVHPDYKTKYTIKQNGTCNLVTNPKFTTNLIHANKALKKDYSELDSFVIYICVKGSFNLVYAEGTIPVITGETILIPNIINLLGIIPHPDARILEVYIQ